MPDTPTEIAQKVSEMMQKKYPIERLMMGCSMYETSRYLVICAIKRDNPHISNTALRQEIFLKFYGRDFDIVQREKILSRLAQFSGPV